MSGPCTDAYTRQVASRQLQQSSSHLLLSMSACGEQESQLLLAELPLHLNLFNFALYLRVCVELMHTGSRLKVFK